MKRHNAIVSSAEESLHLLEVTIRDLISDLVPNVDGLGVTQARLASWAERREEERNRRVGAVIDERLLSYADFSDLETIVTKNWTEFKSCFGDLGRLKVYLHRLSALRNPGAHSRPLLPFEEALVIGMTGEIRQQVTVFRSEGMRTPEPEHFPRITEVRDSFGNRTAGLTKHGPGRKRCDGAAPASVLTRRGRSATPSRPHHGRRRRED